MANTGSPLEAKPIEDVSEALSTALGECKESNYATVLLDPCALKRGPARSRRLRLAKTHSNTSIEHE